MGDSDFSEESWSFSQKPLPVLRLLQESSNGRPLKSPGKSLGQISANDKENYPVLSLTKIRDIRYVVWSVSVGMAVRRILGSDSDSYKNLF